MSWKLIVFQISQHSPLRSRLTRLSPLAEQMLSVAPYLEKSSN